MNTTNVTDNTNTTVTSGVTRPVQHRPSWWRSARAVIRFTTVRVMSPAMVLAFVGLTVLPWLFAMAFASRGALSGDPVPFLMQRFDQLVLGLSLPLLALLLSARAFGAEADDGTLLYLITTTTPRWWMVCVRVLFATVVTGAAAAVAIVGTGGIATGWQDPHHLTRAFVVAALVGATAYAALFTLLALYTRRALVSGLLYVVVWEGVFTRTFPGLNYASVHQWMLSVAGALTTASEAQLASGPSPTWSLAATALVAVVAVVAGGRRLAAPRMGRIGT
jgi:ABC-2 type transport system permease protein